MKEHNPSPTVDGTIPLIEVDGNAYDCGYHYGQIVREKYPSFRKYLDQAQSFNSLSPAVRKLFEQRCPYILDIHRGLIEASGPAKQTGKANPATGCTSFGVSGSVTLDGEPISGQNKDAPENTYLNHHLHIILRMRITGGPTILVLAYPGEVLGYGMWSTGMTIFRNDMFSVAKGEGALTMEQWGMLTLAGKSVHEGAELAKEFGIAEQGNCLISDPSGQSLNVEFNNGGVSIIPAKDGIVTHANHPVGKETSPFEHYPDKTEKENSRHRMARLWELLDAERSRLTAQKAMMCLADHSKYPGGICRHITKYTNQLTTATVVAEPTKGRLHVVKGNPCTNWPTTYTF